MSDHPPDSTNRIRIVGNPTGGLSESILRLIWSERLISRADIARNMNIARSTVSEAVMHLLPTGLIAELGPGESSGGRRPIVLEFQDDSCVVLGVEMGATHVSVALTNLRGRVLAWLDRPFPARNDPAGARALIGELCACCLDEVPGSLARLVGIGIAVPCPVDPKEPDHLSEVVLPAWKGTSGFGEIGEQFGVPIAVDNDANLGALAEGWWGAGRGIDYFSYIKVATGVGCGHVIDGNIFRGATGVAGEIGHVAIDPQGGRCVCGLRGCLATFVGAAALVDRARDLLPEHPDSVLRTDTLTIERIEEAALSGDALALRLAEGAADHLGIAIAGLLNLMNPSLVILGGGLARLGELLLQPIRESVRHRTLVSSIAAAEIRSGELGKQAVSIGASTLVLKAALEDPRLFPVGTTMQENR
ncbi:MAG: ROK family protein [Candidatus Eisenbacteria bacterium]|uniref:ROK family protein n=1 Tax=Eiseniibacteriota bacterium TaxID=2212470 RepID=A0A956SHS9_UNCEI|nr:ROK family protein [Candidatus Eisenbacteria bacterium]